MIQVRPATLDDAAAWAAVVAAASPTLVVDAASERHEMAHDPEGTTRLVAEVGGRVMGVAALRPHGEQADVDVWTDPATRRRGVGGELLRRLESRFAGLGTARATTVVEDDDDSGAFAQRRGYRLTRRLQKVALDPRTVAAPGPTPEGVEVRPVADVGPRAIWALHQQVAADDPSGLTRPQPYDEWRAGWDDPRARPDLGRVAVVDGEPVAYTLLGAAGTRAWSDMTGTLPSYRGRGLSLVLKQHALRAAAAAGIETAFTGNDQENLPMVAVNRRLGYRLVAEPALAERDLRATGRGPA
ncbi:GNAT family N-acetyltransferase [Nocardioides sp. GCM10027113]|uniref:GNAT family N-acetyltransferase n=1 Tax=unclassified Nocardioides TaxID=2615069 RepID=UPI0036159F9E